MLTGEQADGVGAERHGDVRPGGWFIERVAVREPMLNDKMACGVINNDLMVRVGPAPDNQVGAGPRHIRRVSLQPLGYFCQLALASASHCRRCPFSYQTARHRSPPSPGTP